MLNLKFYFHVNPSANKPMNINSAIFCLVFPVQTKRLLQFLKDILY